MIHSLVNITNDIGMKRMVVLIFTFAIVAGVSSIFLLINICHYTIKICPLLIVFMCVGVLVCMYKYNQYVRKELIQVEKNKSDKIEELAAKLKKSEELRARFRSALEDIERQNEKLTHTSHNLTPHEMNMAQVLLNSLNQNRIQPFIAYLNGVEMPLSDMDKQIIIDKTVDIAMLAIDIADSFNWTINNRDEQKINCSIATNDITREEALKAAIQITDNPTITPKWIRALTSSLMSIVSANSGIIYSGYKI